MTRSLSCSGSGFYKTRRGPSLLLTKSPGTLAKPRHEATPCRSGTCSAEGRYLLMAAGKLSLYQAKRDFTKTEEPSGTAPVKPAEHLRFVIQKHAASRLHYDLRLEMDGVFKSWAVTKGPSLDPRDRRLAVEVEDHPLDYGDFEGTIPQGEYGGGTVMLWDQGRWIPEPGKDPRKTIEEGHLHFALEGERMQGEWVMFRLKPRPGEKAEPWILKK